MSTTLAQGRESPVTRPKPYYCLEFAFGVKAVKSGIGWSSGGRRGLQRKEGREGILKAVSTPAKCTFVESALPVVVSRLSTCYTWRYLTSRTGLPSTSMRGAQPMPGLVEALMRPLTRCGAPSALLTGP